MDLVLIILAVGILLCLWFGKIKIKIGDLFVIESSKK
jgi:hypothetical protein